MRRFALLGLILIAAPVAAQQGDSDGARDEPVLRVAPSESSEPSGDGESEQTGQASGNGESAGDSEATGNEESAEDGQASGESTEQASSAAELPETLFAEGRSRETLIVQVLLDRTRHSPGVIDGMMGGNTAQAIRAFQRANDLDESGEITPELIDRLREAASGPVLRRYTLTEEDVSGPFTDIPEDFAAKAELDRLGYSDPAEAIAERFHMDREFLRALNPDADFRSAGTEILVVEPGGDTLSGVARIEIDGELGQLRAYDADGAVIATYPATVGSDEFPSPDGSMTVAAVAAEPVYYFDPEAQDWGPDERLEIAAGPNNPVGSTWIDLEKEGYGIHGSPDPQLIGKTASHGCVRLTNWDAAELAAGVDQQTQVEFVG